MCGSPLGVEQQPQIRGPNLVVGVESEAPEDVRRALAYRFDGVVVVGLALDFHELPQSVDAVEHDGVPVEREERPVLLHDCRRLEPQPREDPGRLVAVAHRGLELLAGLRRRLDKRPLVRDPGRRPRVGGVRLPGRRLLAEPERLVGRGEIAVRGVVVGVDLADSPIRRRAGVVERRPDGVVVGAEFEFDLVHTGRLGGGRKNGGFRAISAVAAAATRNVILKSRTGDSHGMSDEQQADADDSPEDGDVPDDETDGHDDADTEVAEETADDAAVVADGDFVRLGYTLRTADDGQVVDTTDIEVAEDAEIDTEEYEFEPRVIVLGAGHVFESVDDALIGQPVGASGTVEVAAAEAFGEYDDDEVRTVSANKIDEENRYPGAQVQIEGDQGRIITVVSGRARVDFNHPLAGEDLEYDYEILDLVDDREAQAKSLLGMYLQQSPEVWIETDVTEEEQVVETDDDGDDDVETELETVETEQETLYIEATPQMTMNQQWMFSKQQIAQDVMDRLDLDRVIVQETIDGGGGMMGGLGGMMGGPGGAAPEDIEDAIEDVDVDADELAEELDADIEE